MIGIQVKDEDDERESFTVPVAAGKNGTMTCNLERTENRNQSKTNLQYVLMSFSRSYIIVPNALHNGVKVISDLMNLRVTK